MEHMIIVVKDVWKLSKHDSCEAGEIYGCVGLAYRPVWRSIWL